MDIVECGKIINTHGVRGELKVDSYCDDGFFGCIEKVYIENRPYSVRSARTHKGFVLLTLEGVDNMDAAILLKNKEIFARREDMHMEPGELLYQDLYGFDVFDERVGKVLGTLREVLERPASMLFAVDTAKGEVLIPAVEPFYKGADTDKQVLTVCTIEGMLPDED